MPVFFAIFIILPFIEVMVFMIVGQHIGLMTTLLLALSTAVIGGIIVKYQGLRTLFAIRESIAIGKLPLGALFDGICLVAAGALLITPGFVTDTVGFLLVMPPVRDFLKAAIRNHTNWFLEEKTIRRHDNGVIEAEYETLKDE